MKVAGMETVDVTPAFRDVSGLSSAVGALARQAVGQACLAEEFLSWSVIRILDRDQAGASPFRLLPLAVAGGCGLRLDEAVPVAAISRVWWAGVETLDDITDGEFDAARMGMPAAQAIVACTACLSLIPQKAAQLYAPSARLAAAWVREFTDSSLRCADGQLRDLAPGGGAVFWEQAMRAYAGKTGAPYARDAAMTALTAGLPDGQVRGWRSFGALFGVLRQLANDRRGDGRADDADLANGTPTLLLAHAFAELPGPGRDRLAQLRQAATRDPAQRQRLHAQLTGADLAAGFNRRVDAISGCLAALLDRLTAASRYRDLLHWMIAASADQAKVAPAAPDAAGQEVPA
jgi:geranylgeranyl pyrophosphate synthase